MITRREALLRFLKYLVTGGFVAIAWGYVKGGGPTSLKVSFSAMPEVNEVVFKDGVYLVGRKNGPVAFDARCPHLGCGVVHQPGSDHFQCPCHGSQFTIDGRWIKGPAKMDMTALEVRSNEGCGTCCVTLVLS